MSRSIAIESLEKRTFLSTAQLAYTDFASTANLIGNGYGSESIKEGRALQLTSDQFQQARSVWYRTPMPIETFSTEFTFQSNPNTIGADGFTFALLNGPKNAVGLRGRDLGFGNMNWPCQAVAFNAYNYTQFGSKFGFASDGELPRTEKDMSPLDLHSGHIFNAKVTYDGKMLNVEVRDITANRGQVFRASREINLVKELGTNRAIVGFTASTGANRSTQEILSWSYSGTLADPAEQGQTTSPTKPGFASAAQANPNPVTGKTTALSALGQDALDSETDLTYTWRVVGAPAGARRPTFTANASNAAKNTTAYFYKDGAYRFRVTVTNTAGLKAISEVQTRVVQTATAVAITPHRKETRVGKTFDFNATVVDQFGRPMRTQPTIRFALESGDGTINHRTGRFTAGDTTGHVVVSATGSGLTGIAGLLVLPEEVLPTVGAG